MKSTFERRRLLAALLAVPASSLLSARAAYAAEFPDHAIKFIVPFGAGGNADNVGRLLAAAMGPLLGQSLVIDNRAGGGGSLGAAAVAAAPADGYTLLVGTNGPLTINPFVQSRLPYDPLNDFAPVGMAGSVPHVLLANNDLPVKSLQELIALSKRRTIDCGSSGVGSSTHLTLERFNTLTGARIVHVPYRGGNSLVPDVIGGSTQTAAMEFSTALPLHKAGQVRILAVASEQRSPLAPDIPTFIESGVEGFTAGSYVGLLAPARTPERVMKKLEESFDAVLASAAMDERMQSIGLTIASEEQRHPRGFSRFLMADFARSKDAVHMAGIKIE